jgi:hypothetical protein
MDCAVPHVRRERLRGIDYLWVLLLLFPYQCYSCKTRFRRVPSSVGAIGALMILAIFAYPISYVLMKERFEGVAVFEQLYSPLTWLVGQVRDKILVQQ